MKFPNFNIAMLLLVICHVFLGLAVLFTVLSVWRLLAAYSG
ncbi:hypothetical protein SAMN05443246_2979 [Paenibacillus sp. GP183]|nr:hypothetical protein SAMN05443246_2979 [Paenibacillus sp. GP183]